MALEHDDVSELRVGAPVAHRHLAHHPRTGPRPLELPPASGFRLDDGKYVVARVDEPGGPGVAHVRYAVRGHRIGLGVLLDLHATAAQLVDGGVDVRDAPRTLRLRVARAGTAPGDDQLRCRRAEHEPVSRILAGQLQAEHVAVEVPARIEVL